MWVAQGRLAEALDWARAQGLSAEDDLDYPREFAHITLAQGAHRPLRGRSGIIAPPATPSDSSAAS